MKIYHFEKRHLIELNLTVADTDAIHPESVTSIEAVVVVLPYVRGHEGGRFPTVVCSMGRRAAARESVLGDTADAL